MSEYIFRTENPIKDCSICPFVKTAICPSKYDTYIPFGYKRGDCPVNEVPPHGDLKDIQEIEKLIDKIVKDTCISNYARTILSTMLSSIHEIPTVIEANKERK